jgi:hypothetical protein
VGVTAVLAIWDFSRHAARRRENLVTLDLPQRNLMTDFISSSVASNQEFVIKNAYFHFVRYREAGKIGCFPYVARPIFLNIANRGLVKLFSFCFQAGNVRGGRKKLLMLHAG